jgi:hypothetical protein
MRPRKRYKVGYNEQIKDNAKSAYLIKEALNKGTLKPPSDAMVDPSGNPYVFALPAAIVGEEYTRDEQGRITFSSPLQRSNYFYNRNLGEEGISQAREMEASVREGTTNAVQGALQAFFAFSEPLWFLQKALVTAPLAQAMGKLDEVNLNPVAMLSGQDPGISSPSQALGIENPIGAFAIDVLTDPLNYAGIGLLSSIRRQRMKGTWDFPDFPEDVGGGGPARNLLSGGENKQKKPNRYVPESLGDNAFVPKSLMDQGILVKQARPDGTIPASAFENTMNSDNLSSGDKTYIRKALELLPGIANERGDVNLNQLRLAVNNLYTPKMSSTRLHASYGIDTMRAPELGTWEERTSKNMLESEEVLQDLNDSGVYVDEEFFDEIITPLVETANSNIALEQNLNNFTLKPLSEVSDLLSTVEKSVDTKAKSIFSDPLTDENGVTLTDDMQTTAGPYIRFENGEYVPNVSDINSNDVFPLLDDAVSQSNRRMLIERFTKVANDKDFITKAISEDTNNSLSSAVSRLDDDSFSESNMNRIGGTSLDLPEYIVENHPILKIVDDLEYDISKEDYKNIEHIERYLDDAIADPAHRRKSNTIVFGVNYDNFSELDVNSSDSFSALLDESLGHYYDEAERLSNMRNKTAITSNKRLLQAASYARRYYYGLKLLKSERNYLKTQLERTLSNSYLSPESKKEIVTFVSQIADRYFDQERLTSVNSKSREIKYYKPPGDYTQENPFSVIADYYGNRFLDKHFNNTEQSAEAADRFIDSLVGEAGLDASKIYKIPENLPENVDGRYVIIETANVIRNISRTLDSIEKSFKYITDAQNSLFSVSSTNSLSPYLMDLSDVPGTMKRLDNISRTVKLFKELKQDKLSKRNQALQKLVEKGKDPKKVNVGRTSFLLSAGTLLKQAGFRGPRESGNIQEQTHWLDTPSPGAWGHIRVDIDPEDPETLKLLEAQSDLFQISKKGVEQGTKRAKSEFNELEAPFLKSTKDVDTYQRTLLYQALQIAVNNGQTRIAIPTKETATILQGYRTVEDWRPEMDYGERVRKASSPISFPRSGEEIGEDVNASLEKIRNDYEVQARFFSKELNVPLTKENLKGYPYYIIEIPEKFLKRQGEMPTFEKGGKFTIKKIAPKKFLKAMKKK